MYINTKRKSNTNTMQINPQGFNDNMSVAFDDFRNYHNSFSAHHLDVRATTAMVDEFNDAFPDANIPHATTYRPDLDISDAERREKEFLSQDFYRNKIQAVINEDLPFKEKKKFVQKRMQTYLSSIPPVEREKYKGFDYFFEKEAQAARDSEQRLATVNQYAESSFDRFAGTLTGGVGAGFTDPLILGTLPLGFMYGTGKTFTANLLRVTAAEAVIAFGATTAIETQVLPFKESVGIEYTVNDAAKVVLFSTLFGAAIPPVFLGSAKGIQLGYGAAKQQVIKAAANLSPDLKAKLFVDENFDDVKFMEYFAQNIKNLDATELVQVVQELNPTALEKPQVKSVIEDIKNSVDDNLEKPFEAGADGTIEHIRRMEAAADGLRNNEQPRILPESTIPVVVKENRPVAYDVYLQPKEITVDAQTFQFKTGGDAKGVIDTLKGVKQWDRDAAGSLMVFQKEDGTYVIADGHQRLALAKRLQAADPDANIIINASIRREVDGFTPQEVMAEAMIRNVQNGTANASDVARALRVSPEYIARMQNKVAPNSSLYRYATALYKLSDDAWGYFLNSGVSERIAAAVGDLVDDPALHLSVLKVLEQTKPASAIELRTQIDSILQAGSRDVETIDLFGTSTIKETLIVERGKVLAAALNKLKRDKTVMSTLIKNEERIIKDGKNKLDSSYNRTQEEQNAIAIYQIETLANRKGDISEALTRSAKLWADGSKREATETFIETIRGAIERGDTKGLSAVGDRRSAIAEGTSSQIQQIPEPSLNQRQLDNFDDPNNLGQNKKNANQELAELESELEISSNNPELVSGGEIITSPTVKSSDASTQADLATSQATTLDPSESVFASAMATPLSLIDETISIGSFNAISKKPVLQSINDVDQLLQQANKYKPDLETTLNNISIDAKNARIEVRVKELASATAKAAKLQKFNQADPSHMGDYLGGRILVDTLEDVNKVFRAAREQDIKMIEIENYFTSTKDSGYRAIHFNFVTKDGFSMEVQIQHKDLKAAYEQGSAYRKYKDKVNLTAKQEADRAKLAAKDKIVFDQTYEQIKQREGVLDDIDNTEVVIGETVQDGNVVNVTQSLRKFKEDIDNDTRIIGELVTRECV